MNDNLVCVCACCLHAENTDRVNKRMLDIIIMTSSMPLTKAQYAYLHLLDICPAAIAVNKIPMYRVRFALFAIKVTTLMKIP